METPALVQVPGFQGHHRVRDDMAKHRYKPLSAKSKIILAEKRRAAKILRKAGLLRRKSGKITRQYLQESSYFRKLRRQFADVIAGETRVARINRTAARQFREADYRVKRGAKGVYHVVVAKPPFGGQRERPSPTIPPPPRPVIGGAQYNSMIENLIASVITWFEFLHSHYNQIDASRERMAAFAMLARAHPNELMQIMKVTRLDAQRYARGLGSAHQSELQANRFANFFKMEFPELYYYHDQSYALYFPDSFMSAA